MLSELDIIDEQENATRVLEMTWHMQVKLSCQTLCTLDNLPLAILRQIGEELVLYVECEAATKFEHRGFREGVQDRVEWLLSDAGGLSVHAWGPEAGSP